MKLSVIVPAYNASQCLSTCVDSLLQQSIQDYEVIIVDDGSSDNTADIIENYKRQHPDIIKSISVSNGGQGRARNFALRIAKGEYIGFADADDSCAPDMFSKMLTLADNESADIVICDFYRVNNGISYYEKASMHDHPLSSAGAVWNKLYRRSAVGGVRFSEGLWYEDFAFSCKMLLKSTKTVFLPEALYYYNVGHTSTMTNQNAIKNLDIITVMEDIKGYAKREKFDIDLDFLIINHILLEAIKRVNTQRSKDKKIVINKLREYVKTNIPDITQSKAFINESNNRRIIMRLNYDGFENIAELLLKLK